MRIPFLLFILTAYPTLACAALVIHVEPTTIQPSGFGFVNVFIKSDPNETHQVAFADYRFSIEAIGNPAGQIYFLDDYNSSNDAQRQNNDEQGVSNYIFAGKTNASQFRAVIPPEAVSGDVLGGGDYTTADPNSGINENVIVGETPLLLARLEIGQRQTPSATDAFRIVLSLDEDFTSFLDADSVGANNGFRQEGFGPVTIAPTAVPEPSSLLLCGVGLVYAYRRVRTRRSIGSN